MDRSRRRLSLMIAAFVAAGAVVTLAPPAAAAYGIAVQPGSAVEGDTGTTPMTFRVTLTDCPSTNCADQPLQYSTGDFTATGGEDFERITLASYAWQASDCDGNTCTTQLTVNVIGDTTPETDEEMVLDVRVGSPFLMQQVHGRIINDDSDTTLTVSSPTAKEGNTGTTNLSFTVTAHGCFHFDCRDDVIAYRTEPGSATENVDYVHVQGPASFDVENCSFSPRRCTLKVDVPVKGDKTIEPDETVILTVTHQLNGATVQGTGVIDNDDTCQTDTSGTGERGAISGPVHTLDRALPAALGTPVHNLNCNLLAANGL